MALKWLMNFRITLYEDPTGNKTTTFSAKELCLLKFSIKFWFYPLHVLKENSKFR